MPEAFYRAYGFHLCGPRAVRLDILERLADQIRPLLAWRANPAAPSMPPKGATGEGAFKATPEMMSILGCSPEELGNVLRALGFRSERRPVKEAPAPEAPAETDNAAPAIEAPLGTWPRLRILKAKLCQWRRRPLKSRRTRRLRRPNPAKLSRTLQPRSPTPRKRGLPKRSSRRSGGRGGTVTNARRVARGVSATVVRSRCRSRARWNLPRHTQTPQPWRRAAPLGGSEQPRQDEHERPRSDERPRSERQERESRDRGKQHKRGGDERGKGGQERKGGDRRRREERSGGVEIRHAAPPGRKGGADPDSPFASLGALREALEKRAKENSP